MLDTLPARWRAKIADTGSCWLWIGALQSKGYGSTTVNGKGALAHRAVWEHLRGPLPQGLTLDHLCRVKWCVNPEHLEPVTAVENKRRDTAGRTHCLRGHPLSGDNVRVNGNGHRSCRTCAADRRAMGRLTAVA